MWSLAEPSLLPERATVLLVPMEKDGLAEHVSALEEAGFSTMVPPSRQASLTRLRWAHLVVMEVGEDDFEGWQICQTITLRFPSLPVMVVSASNDRNDAQTAMELGAIDQLYLPVAGSALVARIRSHLVRRQSTEQSQEEAERFRQLVMTAPIPLFVIDNGWFRIANAPLGDFVGKPVAQVISDLSITDLLVEEDRPVVMEALREGSGSGDGTLRLPVRVQRVGGDPREAELTLVRLDSNKEPIYTGTLLDISRRRKAVRTGQRKEQYFQSLIEGTHEIIAVVGRSGDVRYMSPSIVRVLGFEPEDLLGSRILSLVHEEDRRSARDLVKRMLASTEQVLSSRCRFRSAEGEWRVVEFTARDLLDVPAVEGVVINARDVTSEQRADEALRASEARFRFLVEGSRDVFFYVRKGDGEAVYMSPSVESILGSVPGELIGKPVPWMQTLGEEGSGRAMKISSPGRVVHLSNSDGGSVKLEVVESPSSEGEGLIQGFARDVTERERMQDALRDAAFQDSLTGLPNRALFMDRVRHAITRMKRHPEQVFAMLFLDLDRFKVINDSLGHGVGDDLLVAVAERLQIHLRPEDTLARFGGDEFAILLEEVGESTDAPRVAGRIAEVFGKPFQLGEYEVYSSASIGIVLGSAIGDSPESLLQNADMAMYRAKSNGGNSFELYDQPMHAEAIRRLQLESHLRKAVDRGELCLHYQPIMNLVDDSIAGAEALVRWNHPTHGLIAPGDFIGLAEETGFITSIGEWVLNAAAEKVGKWRQELGRPDLFVTVNLSSRQLRDSSVLTQVGHAMDRYGLEPRNLKLEITESTVIHSRDRAIRTLRDLIDLGIDVYLDDFGTGYASLSYLHTLPLTGLKIDRSFVDRMHDDSRYAVLVGSIMDIAKGLGLSVIAEGIEKLSQATALLALNCDYAQGFYFSEPVSPEEFPSLLTEKSPELL